MATTITSKLPQGPAAGAAKPQAPEGGPRAVLVLGMHRSGTSALTRVLNLSGVELGSDLMGAIADNNETGFWEHSAIVAIHEALMASFDMRWHDPRALPAGWLDSEAAERARQAIMTVIERDFDGHALWGVKDPRMCRLLPLWRPILATLGIRPAIVHMLRHPLEIAQSIERRDGLPRGHALLLWLRHQIEALRASRGLDQAWVTYDDLMSDWRSATAHLSGALGLPLEVDADAATEISGFLKPRLRHHTLDAAVLEAEPALADWVGVLFAEATRVAGGEPAEPIATALRIESEIDRAGFYFDETFAAWGATEIKLLDQIAWRDGQIRERDSMVSERDGRIAEREGRLAERDSRVAERDARIQQLATEIAQRDAAHAAEIAQRDTQIAYRDEAITQRDEMIAQRDAAHVDQIARHDAAIAEFSRSIEAKDAEVALHRQRAGDLQAQMNALLGSVSWRVTKPLRWVRTRMSKVAGALRLQPHRMRPLQMTDIVATGGGSFQSLGADASMVLASDLGWLPSDLVEISYQFSAARAASPSLFASTDLSLTEAHRVRLPPIREGRQRVRVQLPAGVRLLRFDPVEWAGKFALGDIQIREISPAREITRDLLRLLGNAATHPGRLRHLPGDMVAAYRQTGVQPAIRPGGETARSGIGDYGTWIGLYDTLNDDDRTAIRADIAGFQARPTFSLVMPTYNTPPDVLVKAVDSVRAQLYPDWELCIADDASSDPQTRETLAMLAASDGRVRVTMRETNGHISVASNTALAMATGDYVALLDHDDELPEHALYRVALELNAHPDAAIVYSDEDKIDEHGKRYDPYFKPDFNPDLFLAQNMVSHLGVYRRDLLTAIDGFREGFEGSQDHDLALRALERIRPEQVRHIPAVLYHWRAIEGSVATTTEAKPYAVQAARRAIAEHLLRLGTRVEVVEGDGKVGHRVIFPLPETPPLVSVIVPTRDRLDLLRTVVDGLIETTDYPNWELLIVDNGSERQETLDWFAELVVREPRARVIRDDGPFNFSRLNNRAAAEANGEILLLLNNDVEPIEPGWMTEMVRHAVRPEVGAVGAKLYYPDGTVQHAGVVLGLGGIAGHVHRGIARHDPGYFGRAAVVQDMTAVTAACLMIRKAVYDAIGGFDEQNLAVAFNDIDLCLKVRAAGHRIVWTPYAALYHYESVSRGSDMDPDKIDRFKREIDYMRTRWSDAVAEDPNFNPNLAIDMHVPGLAFPPRTVRPWQGH